MCGVVGSVSRYPVNQLLYDALLLLQHRGQDAAGIATMNGNSYTMHKANGLVRDVFRTRNMRSLVGNVGIGQVRYPNPVICAVWLAMLGLVKYVIPIP